MARRRVLATGAPSSRQPGEVVPLHGTPDHATSNSLNASCSLLGHAPAKKLVKARSPLLQSPAADAADAFKRHRGGLSVPTYNLTRVLNIVRIKPLLAAIRAWVRAVTRAFPDG
jgi:hypothetical protein